MEFVKTGQIWEWKAHEGRSVCFEITEVDTDGEVFMEPLLDSARGYPAAKPLDRDNCITQTYVKSFSSSCWRQLFRLKPR